MNIRIEVDINILYSWAHIKGHLPAAFLLASPGFVYSKATYKGYCNLYKQTHWKYILYKN